MKAEEIQALFDGFKNLHVVVIGDVMVDNYWRGKVERISPEAPVPVVNIERKERRAGGAANVALNCMALGARVSLAGVLGKDESGDYLREFCAEAGIDTQLLQQSDERLTTNKTRVVSHGHQMIRLDEETCAELSTAEEHPFIDAVLRMLQREKPQLLIFEDYNKGVLKENVIDRVMKHCAELGVLTFVDPKKKNFLAYRGASVFKPNLRELREGLDLSFNEVSEENLVAAHRMLQDRIAHQITFVTLSEKGAFAAGEGKPVMLPAHLRNISDVSGAGDTVIATAALVYAVSRDLRLMAEISNIAGGLVCEQEGVLPVNKEDLARECARLLA